MSKPVLIKYKPGLHYVTHLAQSLNVAWSPLALGAALNLWYDASDTSSITATGGLVDQWNDKSGKAQHVTSTLTARPATGANTINGLNVITYAGTNDVLSRTASVSVTAIASTGATVVLVRLFSASGANGLFWTSTQSGSFGDNCSMGRTSANSVAIYGNGTNSSVGFEAGYSDTDNTNPHIQSGVWANAASRNIFLDGTSQATDADNATGLQAVITGIFLGQNLTPNRGASQFLTGQLAEVVFFSGSGSSNRQTVEGYLAWKWGLQANLPVGHPYKNGPP